MKDFIRQEIEKTYTALKTFHEDDTLIGIVAEIGKACGDALQRGNKIMLAGNGGSAADSQHIAAEFVSRLSRDREALAGLALTTDTSILTAAGNDYGFETIFARQVRGLGRPGDVFIGISTSGNSPNILCALEAARESKIVTVGLTGASGGRMEPLCDILLRVPSKQTACIQEMHIKVGHIICAIAESAFLPPSK